MCLRRAGWFNVGSQIAAATVKICGIRTYGQLQSIIDLPIDHIGFVFARSKRQVTADEAAPMVELLSKRREAGTAPLSVGVFVNPTLEELRAVMRQAPLDVIQLHGQESPAFCAEVKEAFGFQVFKALPIASGQEKEGGASAGLSGEGVTDEERIEHLLGPYRGTVDAILLDTYDPVIGGGSGQTFAWDRIPPYLSWTKSAGMKLIVAGGLHAGNVGDLIGEYLPDGVDVSSGVETDGIKDIDKIAAFVERVKSS
ncbi:phosphoribosylanthranilate isomerase [Paenibacillus sp. MBLB4367]|uniref:phosphoribosylanthranilate isomerase n=1 Tax=Paenibacillus sp. MBLB4367 TaxID=3384767 RepID=UPI0039083178